MGTHRDTFIVYPEFHELMEVKGDILEYSFIELSDPQTIQKVIDKFEQIRQQLFTSNK
jgi:hypothetical protein